MTNYTDTSQSSNSQSQFEMGAIQLDGSTKEDWMSKKWRPMMGWVYMSTCTFDFVLAPILWSLLQAMTGGQVTSQWMPLTLQGAGLYHVAMGAVLGLTAFGRTQEKIAGATQISTSNSNRSFNNKPAPTTPTDSAL
ncbi:hypothetical protein EB001_08845 [bacterium]|nr:hypothetical protein [bacterium]